MSSSQMQKNQHCKQGKKTESEEREEKTKTKQNQNWTTPEITWNNSPHSYLLPSYIKFKQNLDIQEKEGKAARWLVTEKMG